MSIDRDESEYKEADILTWCKTRAQTGWPDSIRAGLNWAEEEEGDDGELEGCWSRILAISLFQIITIGDNILWL